MDNKARDVLQTWVEGINARNASVVVGMYSKNSVLFPTFSNKRLVATKEKAAYFDKLFSHENLSVEMHEKTFVSQSLSDNIHSMSGIYCWKFDVEGEILSFESRFTYILDLSRPSPIVHHHSSHIPRML